MSDLVALGDLLDGMVGDDQGFDEVLWAVVEIESLRHRLALARVALTSISKSNLVEAVGTQAGKIQCMNAGSDIARFTLAEIEREEKKRSRI
jgi:hypothetical protein